MLHKLNNVLHWLVRHEGILLMVALVVALRLPTLYEPAWYGDENIYLTIGQGIRKGLVLYKDITDYPNKPPLIYVTAALTRSVFGFRLWLLVWNAFHAIIFYLLVQRVFMGRKRLGYILTLLFVLLSATPLLEGTIANGEIFMIMPTTVAMWLLWNSQIINYSTTSINKLHLFLAGIFFAMGFLFKIPVAADMIAAGIFFFLTPLLDSGRFAGFIRKLVWFGLGWLLPIGVVLMILTIQGVPPLSMVRNMIGSAGYVAVWRPQNGLAAFLTFTSLPSRLVLAGLLTGFLLGLRKYLSATGLFAGLWSVWALFGALLSARPYLHYLVQTLPPLVILIGVIVVRVKKADVLLGLMVLTVVGLAYWRFGFRSGPLLTYYRNFGAFAGGGISQEEWYQRFDGRMARNYRVAAFLREHTLPRQRVYIWGTEPDIYVLADRLPVGNLTTSFHTEDLHAYERIGDEVATLLPAYVVWMTNEPRAFPQLKQLLEMKYMPVVQVDEAMVYRRFPGALN